MLGKFAQDLSRFYESAFRLFGHKAGERQRSTRSSGNYCFLALSWVYRILYLFVDSLVLRICFIPRPKLRRAFQLYREPSEIY